jgi:hypothetical protein
MEAIEGIWHQGVPSSGTQVWCFNRHFRLGFAWMIFNCLSINTQLPCHHYRPFLSFISSCGYHFKAEPIITHVAGSDFTLHDWLSCVALYREATWVGAAHFNNDSHLLNRLFVIMIVNCLYCGRKRSQLLVLLLFSDLVLMLISELIKTS